MAFEEGSGESDSVSTSSETPKNLTTSLPLTNLHPTAKSQSPTIAAAADIPPNIPPNSSPPVSYDVQCSPLDGFEDLDPVQRYSIGALAVVLLNRHANDLNGIAFARTQSIALLDALRLRPSQQEALLALNPSESTRNAVVSQCVDLVGATHHRFRALQTMLALAVASGNYDARSRAFLASVADNFGIAWPAVAAIEVAVALRILTEPPGDGIRPGVARYGAGRSGNAQTLFNKESDIKKESDNEQAQQSHKDIPEEVDFYIESERISISDTPSPIPEHSSDESQRPSADQLLTRRRKKKQRVRKAIKIGGITLVGGMLFGLTGGLIAPALLSALAGVGVASAAGLAASGSLASGAVVGGLFGVAGGGFTLRKARNRVSTSLEEFDFECATDPHVIQEEGRGTTQDHQEVQKDASDSPAPTEDIYEDTEIGIIDSASDGMDIFTSNGRVADEDDPSSVAASKAASEDVHLDENSKNKKSAPQSGGLQVSPSISSLHVCICVPAWLTKLGIGSSLDQFEAALKDELPFSQHIAVRWESRRLYEMGLAFAKFWASKATVTTVQQAYPHAVAAASTVAGAVAFAFAIPLTVMSCMDYIDNPWSILVSRSNGAGEELANALVERSYGHRPVTLFGYSLGARVVFKCLECLASRGALGIVENVFLVGAAVTAEPERWRKIRGVVAGRIVNAYGSFDWALAFFHRGCGHGVYISGLRRVDVDGVENLNMSYLGVDGHRELKDCVPRVMRAVGIGLGYISMPPAKLVLKSGKRIAEGEEQFHTAVCEEPGTGEWGDSGVSMADCGSEEAKTDPLEDTPNKMGIADDTCPKRFTSQNLSKQRASDIAGSAGNCGDVEVATETKKKSKSWLAWGSWSNGKLHSHSKKQKSSKNRREAYGEHAGAGSQSMKNDDQKTGPDRNEGLERETNGSAIFEISENSDDQLYVGTLQNDQPAEGPYVASSGRASTSSEDFDWNQQRKIWEEQEQQILERGYADTASEIAMRKKVLLSISLEVAGRRLERFIDQDATLPVQKKVVVFTNCVDDQRGMQIRIYEHEKRTKSLPCNMLRRDRTYPKLIADLRLEFDEAAVKGRLRVAVGISAEENGDIVIFAEERLHNGVVGDRCEACVPRSELCTVEERRAMEADQKQVHELTSTEQTLSLQS